jgi:pilus assembly protein CpaE
MTTASPEAGVAPQVAPLPRVSIQAFCETQELANAIQSATSDRRMIKTQVKVNMGGAPAAVEAYRSAPTPNAIVLEFSNDREALLSNLDQLSEFCDPGTKVIVAGKINDIVLYRELMTRGVSEYLVAPFGAFEFIASLSQLYHAPGAAAVGRVTAVMAAKGGAGSSGIAHNLAWAIARSLETATVLVDMNLPFGTAGLNFNQDPPQGIAEAVFAPDRLDANLVERLLSKCTDHLSLLAAPAVLDKNYDFAETAFDHLVDILRSTTPNIVLDIPHLWSGWTRRMLIGADEVVIVAAPDLSNLRNAKSLLDTLRAARTNDAKPRLVLNMVGMMKRPEISVADFAKAVDVEPAAIISHDAKLFGTAANNGQMIGEIEGNHKIAETFNDLARLVSGRPALQPRAKRNLLEPLMARLQRKKV